MTDRLIEAIDKVMREGIKPIDYSKEYPECCKITGSERMFTKTCTGCGVVMDEGEPNEVLCCQITCGGACPRCNDCVKRTEGLR